MEWNGKDDDRNRKEEGHGNYLGNKCNVGKTKLDSGKHKGNIRKLNFFKINAWKTKAKDKKIKMERLKGDA